MSSEPDRFASGANPAPGWWGTHQTTRQTTRLLSRQQGGGSGTRPPSGRAPAARSRSDFALSFAACCDGDADPSLTE